jgi:hypothetical protein
LSEPSAFFAALGRDALPIAEQRLLQSRYIPFHAICLRLSVGGLRSRFAKSRQSDDQQRHSNALEHAELTH